MRATFVIAVVLALIAAWAAPLLRFAPMGYFSASFLCCPSTVITIVLGCVRCYFRGQRPSGSSPS
jgi:hypothetical protein